MKRKVADGIIKKLREQDYIKTLSVNVNSNQKASKVTATFNFNTKHLAVKATEKGFEQVKDLLKKIFG